jgi:hypothetical protein
LLAREWDLLCQKGQMIRDVFMREPEAETS